MFLFAVVLLSISCGKSKSPQDQIYLQSAQQGYELFSAESCPLVASGQCSESMLIDKSTGLMSVTQGNVLRVDPQDQLDFEFLAYGSVATRIIEIHNVSQTETAKNLASRAVLLGVGFSRNDTTCPSSLAPLQSCAFFIKYRPDGISLNFSGIFQVRYTNSSTGEQGLSSPVALLGSSNLRPVATPTPVPSPVATPISTPIPTPDATPIATPSSTPMPTAPPLLAEVTINPGQGVHFGPTDLGTKKFSILTISNLGPGSANLLSLKTGLLGYGFRKLTEDCPMNLAKGQSCSYSIQFFPDTLSRPTYQTVFTIRFSDGGGDHELTVPLSGSTIFPAVTTPTPTSTPITTATPVSTPTATPPPNLTTVEISPALSFDFGPTLFGTKKTTVVTVTNTGSGTALLLTLKTGLLGYGFRKLTEDCPVNLSAGKSCSYGIQFFPDTLSRSTYSTSFTIRYSDDLGDHESSISILGSTIFPTPSATPTTTPTPTPVSTPTPSPTPVISPAQITLAPSVLTFYGGEQKTITITNSSAGTATALAFKTGTLGSGLNFVSENCPRDLAPQASCQAVIKSTPSAGVQSSAAQFGVSYGDGTGQTLTIYVNLMGYP